MVGRLQHDRLIPWNYQNHLKRDVNLSYVAQMVDAVEETWPDQTEAKRVLMRELNLPEHQVRSRLRRAQASGILETNGRTGYARRLDPLSFTAFRLVVRDRSLDAQDAKKAEAKPNRMPCER